MLTAIILAYMIDPEILVPFILPDWYDVQSTAQRTIAGELWELEVSRHYYPTDGSSPFWLHVSANGHRVKTVSSDAVLSATFSEWPFADAALVVHEDAWAGHGRTTTVYPISGNTIGEKVWEFKGERGGPVFEDYDGDGVVEVVTDNFEWYAHFDDPPAKYLVYKLSEDGTLRFWKEVPDTSGERLPYSFGFGDL